MNFDPTNIEGMALCVDVVRLNILKEGDTSGAAVMAEPHFLIAMSLLEQAAHNFRLASYHQARANADRNH